MKQKETLGKKISKNWVREAYERRQKREEFMKPLQGNEIVIVNVNTDDKIGKHFAKLF